MCSFFLLSYHSNHYRLALNLDWLIFIIVLPWVLAILYLCYYGAFKMSSLINDVLTQSVQTTNSRKINEYKEIMTSIRVTANRIAVSVSVAMIGSLTLCFELVFDNSAYDSPIGLWYQPATWCGIVIFCFGVTSANVAVYVFLLSFFLSLTKKKAHQTNRFLYVHPKVTSYKRKDESDKEISHSGTPSSPGMVGPPHLQVGAISPKVMTEDSNTDHQHSINNSPSP
jgi:hypothetical protein